MEEAIILGAKRALRKLGIKEASKTVHFPEQTISNSPSSPDIPLNFVPVAGKTYTVSLDGIIYKSEAKTLPMADLEFICLGNIALLGGEDTGEPWRIVYLDMDGAMFQWVDEGIRETTLSIYEETEATPISEKYLPGVCLPVVELETVVTMEGVALTEAESAALTAVFKQETPVVIKCMFGQYSLCFVVNRMMIFDTSELAQNMFSGSVTNVVISFYPQDGTWYAHSELVGGD